MTLPKKSQIVAHWKDWLDRKCIDWGEPSCWACNRFWGTKYDVEGGFSSYKHWDKVKQLEKCHIIPRQFGGSDTEDNLFLMCKRCHDRAPNTKSREYFLKWAQNQCWVTAKIEMIEKELKTYGLENKVEEIINITKNKPSDLPHKIKSQLGTHFDKRLGSRITLSTFIAAIAMYIHDEEENI